MSVNTLVQPEPVSPCPAPSPVCERRWSTEIDKDRLSRRRSARSQPWQSLFGPVGSHPIRPMPSLVVRRRRRLWCGGGGALAIQQAGDTLTIRGRIHLPCTRPVKRALAPAGDDVSFMLITMSFSDIHRGLFSDTCLNCGLMPACGPNEHLPSNRQRRQQQKGKRDESRPTEPVEWLKLV